MTGQEIVDAVRAEMVEPNPAFFTTPALLRWLNNAQKNFVRRTRVCQNFAQTSTVQGQADYPMPADWLGSEKVFWNYVINGVDNWRPLIPISIEKMAQQFPNFLSNDPSMLGNPQYYYIVNQTLFIFPKPQNNGTNDVFMFYESKPVAMTSLSDSLSIDDSLSDALEAYLLWKMNKMDQEPQSAETERIRYEGQMPGGSGGLIGEGLKWKKKRILDGKWKIDIESFLPFNYSSVNNSAFNNQVNPLNQ